MQNQKGLARQAARALGKITALFLEHCKESDFHAINMMPEEELVRNIAGINGLGVRTIAVKNLLKYVHSKSNDATEEFISLSQNLILRQPFILAEPITIKKPSFSITCESDSDYDIAARGKHNFSLERFWVMFYIHAIDRKLGQILTMSEDCVLSSQAHYITYVELKKAVVAVYIYIPLNTKSWSLRIEDISNKKRKSVVQLPLHHLYY